MTDATTSEPAGDPAAAAAYVGAMSAELSRIARASGLLTLAYILEMARLEAKAIAGDGPPLGHGRPQGSASDPVE